jgi:hypothetical protein
MDRIREWIAASSPPLPTGRRKKIILQSRFFNLDVEFAGGENNRVARWSA